MRKIITALSVISLVLVITHTALAISPDIKANNSDDPVTIQQADNLSVTVSLDPKGSSGMNCDWWVAVNTPFPSPNDWFYYNLSLGWTPGLSFTYQGPLIALSPVEVLNISGLPAGTYTFYFAVDTNMNGTLDMDQIYFDRVEVIVTTDGVENTAPTATITSPSDGSAYTEGESIAFSGTGSDPEDGNYLSGSSLVWRSSRDGQIGTGLNFGKSNLSLGTHTITLIVTDSGGLTDTDSIVITISTTVDLSAPLVLTATASDSTLSLSWVSVSGARGYNLYYGFSSGNYEGSVDVGNTISKSFSGIPNDTYYFVVTAYAGSAESDYSGEASVTVNASGSFDVFKLPDTGLTASYTDTFGEDSDYTINPPSYTDNGDKTVTDNRTGLMWQREVDNILYDWYKASGTENSVYNPGGVTGVCNSLTLAGYSDWRLPNYYELADLIYLGNPQDGTSSFSWLIDDIFSPNFPNEGWYWTSTTQYRERSDGVRLESFEAWYVSFIPGTLPDGNVNFGPMSLELSVRCVRGGQ